MISTALRGTLAAALLCAFASAGHAAALRPEVGKPLAKAEAYMNARNYTAAMAQVRLAAAARGLTPDESFVVEETRGAIAGRMGDNATAAKVYADMLNSGRVAPAQAAVLLKAEASLAFNAKNYPAAIGWIQRYLKTNPSDGAMRTQLITAYYLNKDFANAGKLQAAQVAATVRAGQRPTEEQLQLLAACQREGGDTLGFGNTMVQLVTYYPKPDYWLNLVHSAQTRPGFSSRLTLDIDRFNMAIGVPAKPDDLMEMTELALQVPLPGEAKAIVDDGYAKGVFGTGPGAPRQQRLRDLVNKTYASEKATLAGREAEAQASHDGNLLASLGEEYVSYGDYPKGIALMKAGLQKGGLRHPDDTRLHLGLAYLNAGQKAAGVATLRTVGGKEGAAEVARLWILKSAHA
jgi:tetratricopeptide (TPR) repeat protein